jgi:Tol biopolymer transport system component
VTANRYPRGVALPLQERCHRSEAVQSVYLIAAAGGAAQRITDDEQHHAIQGWSPDGAALLVLSAMQPEGISGYHARLRTLTLNGAARELTGDWGNLG